MGLPKIKHILYPITIYSTGQETSFRPYTVKEEKILLTARESDSVEQIIMAVKQIVNNCVTDVDVEKLALFDLEYLLLKIRAKSVNEIVEFKTKDPDTGEIVELKANLDEIEMNEDENHSKIIKVNDEISIVMRYPSIAQLEVMSKDGENNETAFNTMVDCIESVVEGDTVYSLADFSEKEVYEFIDSLESNTLEDIKTFFNTMPTLRYEMNYKLKDGTEKKLVVQGMDSFFI